MGTTLPPFNWRVPLGTDRPAGHTQMTDLATDIAGTVGAMESSTQAALKAKHPMMVKTGSNISSPAATTNTNMGCPTILKDTDDSSLIGATASAIRVLKACIVQVQCWVTFAFTGDNMRVTTTHIMQVNASDYFMPAAWWGTGGPRMMVSVSRNGSVVPGSTETDFWAGSNPSVISYNNPMIAVTVLEVL